MDEEGTISCLVGWTDADGQDQQRQRQARGEQGQFGFEVSFRSRVDMPDSLIPGATSVAYFIPAQLGTQVPEAGDLVVSGTHRYTIMRCDALKPGDELILYYAQLSE
jgi:hypothetical protein